jgi:hypothetical protein
MIQRIAIVALSCASLPALADTSLVLGRAISQFDDVQIRLTPEEICPLDAICLWAWSRWTLETKQTISGPAVPNGRTYAIKMQHTSVVDSTFKKPLLFILEHIDDPDERKRLHADYKLLDITAAEAMICTRTDPKLLDVPQDDIYRQDSEDGTQFCFRDPRIVRD